jgi:hypothetical protein
VETGSPEKHALALGKVLLNFHALEISLRHFFRAYEAAMNPNNTRVQVKAKPVGQIVPMDSFSVHDSLNGLVRKFNSIVGSAHRELTVDPAVIELRDALAHGRVWSEKSGAPVQLLRFTKPTPGKVTISITHADTVDEAWLDAQGTRVALETEKVAKAGGILYPA